MNREQAKLLAPIIKAFGDGETIQFFNTSGYGAHRVWMDVQRLDSAFDSFEFRIKPKPRKVTIAYVPGNSQIQPSFVTSSTAWVHGGAKTIEVELPE